MSMVIGTNVGSLTAQRHLASSRNDMDTSMERLSSGKRINSAMDDAAGLAIAGRMNAQIEGMNQGVRNANDGLSLVATAEGAMEEVSSLLLRMRELAVQGSNETNSTTDLTSMDTEFDALKAEINRISNVTLFNGIDVVGAADTIDIQVGDASGDIIQITLKDMGQAAIGAGADTVVTYGSAVETTANASGAKNKFTHTLTTGPATGNDAIYTVNGNEYRTTFRTDAATTMSDLAALVQAGEGHTATSSGTTLVLESATNGVGITVGNLQTVNPATSGALTSIGVDTQTKAIAAITSIDAAISDVADYRGELGATSSQLTHTVSNLMNRSENTSAAKSRIEDADFAVESASLAKNQVLQQAGTAMLAQANASGQSVLSLLK